MRISDWSSDVCSSDLARSASSAETLVENEGQPEGDDHKRQIVVGLRPLRLGLVAAVDDGQDGGDAGIDSGRKVTAPEPWQDVVPDDQGRPDRKRVVSGKRVSVSVDLG